MRIAYSALVALMLAYSPAAVVGQTSASGILAPNGPPERPPVRVDAGGACVVDLVQDYIIEGTLIGELTFDYRILVDGPCGSPAGTFDEEWIAHGEFFGTALGQKVTASVLYTAEVRAGGSVRGNVILHGGVEADLEVTGEFADQRLSYSGRIEVSQDGSR